MTLGEYNLDEALADLASDEAAHPIVLLASMPRWWRDTLIAVFATSN